MAVMSGDQVVHEDLSDELILADVRETPVTSRMRKGEKVKDILYSWPLENMGIRHTTPPPENADVGAFETDKEYRLYNRIQEFWRTPRVSKIAEKVTDSAGRWGKYNHQLTKKTKEQKRDIETVILSAQMAAEDDGHIGSRMMGFFAAINDGALPFTDPQTAIPAGFRTPTTQIYTGALTALTEAAFVDMLKSRFDSLGQTTELVLFAGSSLKRTISETFGRYMPDKPGFSVIVRTQTQAIDSRKYAAYGIDLYEGDFGTFEIVLVSFIPDAKWGIGLNMEYIQMRPLMFCEHDYLPYQGGGISGLIDSILGYEFGDPRGAFAIRAT
jgi:Family of unknown function (DUF5309)